MSCLDIFSFSDLIVPGLSTVVVVIGWRVIYANARKLASRNETHSQVQKLDDVLNDIDHLCSSFWAGEVIENIDAELQRKERLSASSSFMNRYAQYYVSVRYYLSTLEKHSKLEGLNFEMVKLKKLATLDSEYRSEISMSQVAKISSLINSTRSGLWDSFRCTYPVS